MPTLDTIRLAVSPIFKRYGVAHASVFGSVARGDAHSESDIDLLVSLKEPIGLIRFFEMQDSLEETLGRKVDLATRKSLSSRFVQRIERDLTPIYEG